jgi:hypothetical protein
MLTVKEVSSPSQRERLPDRTTRPSKGNHPPRSQAGQRLGHDACSVNQWFSPDDLGALLKLTRVLATELANDGCMDSELRQQLRDIAARLNQTLDEITPEHATNGATQR